VFANLERGAPNALALDGVSCTVCHQISASNLGTHASFDGGFAIETATPLGERPIFGPHAIDGGRQGVMQSAALFVPSEATHLQRSELCATCHTLFTQSLNDAGEVVGELPEQVPYQEWLASEYRETQSCQSCHMPEVAADTPIASVLGQPRPRLSQHTFRGANAFMLGVLNKHRTELGVTALSQELDGAIRETKAYLESAAAKVTIEAARRRGAQLEFDVVIASTTGHKLPTAYPSRRAWLHATVRAADGRIVFESGAPRADGSIAGNDNDADALQFEPHYAEVRRADEVQIYESIMVDQAGRVTTGLLRGVRYAKDNRLLPRGFDKTTAPPEVAVHGGAAEDADFTAGGDRVRYRVDLPDERGELAVTVQLRYQSVAYRWAQNLRAYEAAETQRFVAYYDGSAAGSALLLGAAAEVVPAR
jgi:hypothetical protein